MTSANIVTWAGRAIYNNRLSGSGTAPVNLGWGLSNGVSDSAFSDVNLFEQANPSPESRVAGVTSILTSNQLGDTFQVVGTITALSSKAITEVALFDTATSLSGMQPTSNTISSTTATTIYVGANSAGFANLPGSGNYYAQLDNEVVLVTAGQGTATLTVSRGQLGSSNATHGNGAFLTCGGDGGTYIANSSASGSSWNAAGANGGSAFTHADFAVINLNTSDSIQFTLKVQLS